MKKITSVLLLILSVSISANSIYLKSMTNNVTIETLKDVDGNIINIKEINEGDNLLSLQLLKTLELELSSDYSIVDEEKAKYIIEILPLFFTTQEPIDMQHGSVISTKYIDRKEASLLVVIKNTDTNIINFKNIATIDAPMYIIRTSVGDIKRYIKKIIDK